RLIKSLVIHYLRRFGAALDQFRPVGGLHSRRNTIRQPVDTPARGEMDAAVNAVLKRMPIPAELKINQLHSVVSNQTIIGARIVMKICKEWARFGHVSGYDFQFFINSQSRLDSGDLRHAAKRLGEPVAPIARGIDSARSQGAADTLELGLLAY